MNRREFIRSGLYTLGSVSFCGCTFLRNAPGRRPSAPNILFILADDMGYGDIQAYNPESKIPTPHLNGLAGEGMRFTDAHSGSAVCTPTRYGVLTGRYCWRTRLKRGVLFPPNDRPLIGRDRLTVAGMLKQKNYHTACIGKWHLGMEWGRDDQGEVDFSRSLKYGPTDVGFDAFFGIAGSLDMIPYVFYRNRKPTQAAMETQSALPFPRFIRKGPKARDFDPGEVLDRLTEEAVAYIEKHAGDGRSFFLYLPLTAPHKPVWPADRFKGNTALGPYGDFVAQTDWAVGQVLRALERAGATGDTLAVYTSDNGSYMYRRPLDQQDHTQDPGVQGYHPPNHRPNAGWRGTKADIWEAGHRVPFIVRWPGVVESGSLCENAICLTDFMATCAEITGYTLPENAAEDSISLLPHLSGRDRAMARAPVVHHSSNGMFSLRDGRWKMVFGNGSGGREKPAGKPFEKPYFLFDLEEDPSETRNVIDAHPDIAERMEGQLERIMREKGSRFL